jgi:hypothetical protein
MSGGLAVLTTATTKRGASAPLEGYIRHAERHGVELVFETAIGLTWPVRAELSDQQLGRLAAELRAIDPKWRLPRAESGFAIRPLEAGDFAIRLIAAGIPEAAAARMAGISIRTLQRRQRPARELLRQVQQVAESRSEPAFQSGVRATNPGWEGNHPHPASLSLSGRENGLPAGQITIGDLLPNWVERRDYSRGRPS